jgi:hypothetical protein
MFEGLTLYIGQRVPMRLHWEGLVKVSHLSDGKEHFTYSSVLVKRRKDHTNRQSGRYRHCRPPLSESRRRISLMEMGRRLYQRRCTQRQDTIHSRCTCTNVEHRATPIRTTSCAKANQDPFHSTRRSRAEALLLAARGVGHTHGRKHYL